MNYLALKRTILPDRGGDDIKMWNPLPYFLESYNNLKEYGEGEYAVYLTEGEPPTFAYVETVVVRASSTPNHEIVSVDQI